MISYIGNKRAAALFAADILLDSRCVSALITIITRGTSEDCSVHIAIDTSLEDIVKTKAVTFSVQLMNISQESISDG